MILSLTFSQSFFEQNVSEQLKLLRFSAIFFQNKARNAGRSGENTGMREICQNAGFPARLRDGWHLSMVTQVGSFILVYVECKVAIPMVSTRKTDDDHHVADSEAIGRLRHKLIKSTGNPRISSGVKSQIRHRHRPNQCQRNTLWRNVVNQRQLNFECRDADEPECAIL